MDGITADAFAATADERLERLSLRLADGTYTPLPLRPLTLGGSGKTRTLAIPTVEDRIVQTSLLLTIQPRLETLLSDAAFAYRPGRGVAQALRRLEQRLDAQHPFAAQGDIASFFDEIPLPPLWNVLGQALHDDHLLALLQRCTAAPLAGRTGIAERGLPQGGVLSPILSNVYLLPFDQTLASKGLVRYADDFVVPARSPDDAYALLDRARQSLETLGLRLHPEKSRVVSKAEGFTFLGARIGAPETSASPTPPARPPATLHLAVPTVRLTDPLTSVLTLRPIPHGHPTRPTLPHAAPSSSRHTDESLDEDGKIDIDRYDLESLDAETITPPAADLPDDDAPGVPARSHRLPRPLYLHTHGATVGLHGDALHVFAPGNATPTLRVGVARVAEIVVLGHVTLTPATLRRCLASGIPVTYLSTSGRFAGRLEAEPQRAADVVRAQCALSANAAACLALAQSLVEAKVRNSRALLARARRHHDDPALHEAARQLARLARRIPLAPSLDILRGLEGAAAAAYFDAFGLLVRHPDFTFTTRSRRPPRDPVNALLSFLYTLAHGTLHGHVARARLHPFVGFFHADAHAHPALVSDLLEPFRPRIDALALRLLNRHELSPAMFDVHGAGVYLNDEGRALVLRTWQAFLRRSTATPDGQPSTYWHRMAEQTQSILRLVRGDAETFAPFTWNA